MSEVIPSEKGVCRIVFESTDNNDYYCLDVDAESETDQSENSSCEENKIREDEYKNSDTHYSWKEFDKWKDKVVNKIEYSSESECEDAQKRKKLSSTKQYDEAKQRPQFQHLPDLSYLLENDNNTIRKSFSHQHQNGLIENFEMIVPEVQNNSQSYMEITDAVRRLTELLVLPINPSQIKENYISHREESVVLERENMFDSISIQEECSIHYTDFLKNPCHLSQQKLNCATVVDDNCQVQATFETNSRRLGESSQQDLYKTNNKDVVFDYGSDDTMDFNMAVEALHLLKNKGRIHFNSLDGYKPPLLNIDAASCNMSDEVEVPKESSLPDSTVGTYSINEPIPNCSKTENIHVPLFDSTLEIRDCATGAIIPFELIYQGNHTDFSITDENELSISNEIQTDRIIIPSTLAQLSNTVTCVKVPLNKSVLYDCDQESSGRDNSYPPQHQVEVKQINSLTDTQFQISKNYSSLLPEATIPKEKEYKTTSLNQKRSKKTKRNTDGSLFSAKKAKGHKSHLKVSPKLLIKKLPLKPNKQKFKDQPEEMTKDIEKRRSSQSSKTSDCSFEHSFQLSTSPTNVSSMNEVSVLENDSNYGHKNWAQKSNNLLPQALLSSSSELEGALNQTPATPTYQQEDEHEKGNPDKFQNVCVSPEPQLSEEKKLTEKIKQDFGFETIRTPLDAFNLFINDGMIKRIVKYTNQKILGASKKITILGYKRATNEIELRAFIGILLISAALKQNQMRVAELWSECFGPSIYRASLQEGRFNIFLQNVCFGDPTSTDKTSKKNVFQIGDPWEEYLDNCKRYHMPNVPKDEDSKQHYTAVRKTTNLSLSVLFSMLDTAVIRGSAIFQNENPHSGMCIQTFFKQVGMSLVKPQLEEKLMGSTISNSMRELIERILSKKCKISRISVLHPVVDQNLKKQKRCQLCTWNKDRKTRYKCICCQRNMCREHRAQLCVQCIDSV